MKNVDIQLRLSLDDDVADWVSSRKDSPEFSSDLSYYLTQSMLGGYIITQDKLDVIIDGILDSEDAMNNDPDVLENVVKKAMMEVISSSINISDLTKIAQTQNVESVEVKEDIDDTPAEDVNVIEFNDSSEESSEEFSDDDAADLADMFGF